MDFLNDILKMLLTMGILSYVIIFLFLYQRYILMMNTIQNKSEGHKDVKILK